MINTTKQFREKKYLFCSPSIFQVEQDVIFLKLSHDYQVETKLTSQNIA